MNPFARAQREMKSAVLADLQIFIEVLVVKHRRTLLALRPKPFWNFSFTRFGRSHFRLLRERRICVRRRRRDRWFSGIDAEGFFCEGGSSHNYSLHGVARRHVFKPRPDCAV